MRGQYRDGYVCFSLVRVRDSLLFLTERLSVDVATSRWQQLCLHGYHERSVALICHVNSQDFRHALHSMVSKTEGSFRTSIVVIHRIFIELI